MNDKILVLDFGSQLTQLIARRVRELNVYSEVHPHDASDSLIKQFNPKGIILSGGPNSTYRANTPKIPSIVFELGIPILGICYGMQAMALQLGGLVEESSNKREFGYARVYNTKSSLFDGISDGFDNSQSYIDVWMSHGDKVTKLPDGFEVIASSESCTIAAMYNKVRNFYGVQFHPEVTHTKQGIDILRRFVKNICNCDMSWTTSSFIHSSVNLIKERVGNDKVILALSGGVDSSVTAALIEKAIGNNLHCIFVDNGLLRYNETKLVMDTYEKHMGINIKKVDAKDRFYRALSGVVDPEEKRKIIGKLFIDIFQDEGCRIPNAKFLAQGTIYPDVIESAGINNKAHSIKSHHNVGGLPDILHLELIEPLRELFKDEVRSVGLALGLPKHMIYRHPFPGPGLAVRILGEVKPQFVELLQKADHIFIEELRANNYYDKVSQAFAVFLPLKSVGVMGDKRTYEYVVSLRAVETNDFMTANVALLPLEFITHVANKIVNEVKGINRVVYDVSGKPPSTIEWE